MEVRNISWKQFGEESEELVQKIKDSKLVFDGVYGIPRGGLPLAVIVSHRLGLPLLLYPTKNSLVVDEISDTGKTLKSFKNRKIATLYTTPWTVTAPDFFVGTKEMKTDWIVFPWENKDV